MNVHDRMNTRVKVLIIHDLNGEKWVLWSKDTTKRRLAS